MCRPSTVMVCVRSFQAELLPRLKLLEIGSKLNWLYTRSTFISLDHYQVDIKAVEEMAVNWSNIDTGMMHVASTLSLGGFVY